MVELNEKALEVGQRVEKFTGEARWFGTILSTYTTGRGKVRHVVEVEPQGFQMIAVPEQLRPAPALPAPDDGLVERGVGIVRKWADWIISASEDMDEAEWPGASRDTVKADRDAVIVALQSQAEQIERWRQNSIDTWSAIFTEKERLTRERDDFQIGYIKAIDKLDAAEQQVQKIKAQNERLREALSPFKAIADEYSDSEDGDFQVWQDFDVLGATLPLRIFRRARSALETQDDQK